MKLNPDQRQFIADKIMDSANYALAGLVFGEMITKTGRPGLLVLGGVIYVSGWITAIYLKKRKR